MIAVISDSHVPGRAPEIPEQFMDILEEAERVVHCGDFETRDVFEEIDERADEIVAVKGNCDRFNLPNSEVFTREEVSFGVYHGTGIQPRGDHETLLKIAEKDLDVDILLHGHTHHQEAVRKDGKLLLNPGSCTGVGGGSSTRGNPKMMVLRFEQELEVGLLELEDGEIREKDKVFSLEGLKNSECTV